MDESQREAKRFWEKVDKAGDCWLWTASEASGGYGQFRYRGKATKAHRVAWTLANGAIPDGLWVLHKCDVRRCVRPDHLFLGTNADNVADCIQKGRNSRGAQHGARTRPEKRNRGERHGMAKLTEVDVSVIRYWSGRISQTFIAKLYGVSQSAISMIHSGKRWPHTAKPEVSK